MFTTYKKILVQYDHGLFMISDYIARGKQLALDQPRRWKNILGCWCLKFLGFLEIDAPNAIWVCIEKAFDSFIQRAKEEQ
jgi:hypothetical protein